MSAKAASRKPKRGSGPTPNLLSMLEGCFAQLAALASDSGVAPDEIRRILLECVSKLPAPSTSQNRGRAQPPKPDPSRDVANKLFPIANQVVTEWRKDPQYVDRYGSPLILPKAGRCSLTTLVKAVSRNGKVDAILAYLISTGTVARVSGAKYQLKRPWMLLQGDAGRWYQIRYIQQTLNTARNNLYPRPEAARFQRMVEHVRIPVTKLPLVERHLERRGMELLQWFDALLRRYSAGRHGGGRTIWLAVALQLLQQSGNGLNSGSRGASKRNRGRRT
jgi:hypothetical protein